MKRVLAWAIAAFAALNGLVMLVAGRWWYGAVPGVTETGPFNPQFVEDIGAAFLTAGLGFAWIEARGSSAGRGAAAAGAMVLAVPALIHLARAFAPGGLADLSRDFPGVILPALVAAWIVWPPGKGDAHA